MTDVSQSSPAPAGGTGLPGVSGPPAGSPGAPTIPLGGVVPGSTLTPTFLVPPVVPEAPLVPRGFQPPGTANQTMQQPTIQQPTLSSPPLQSTGGHGGPPPGGFSGPIASSFPTPTAASTPQNRSGMGGVVVGALVGALVASIVGGILFVTVGRNDGSTTRVVQGSRPTSAVAGAPLDIGALLDKVRPSVVTIHTNVLGSGEAAGSGVVIDETGTVLTNAHVINGASTIGIAFADGDTQDATLVGSFPDQDIALIKTKAPKETVAAELGSSDALQVGDDVVAIGNALNLGAQPSVTKGIVSAVGRELAAEGEQLEDLIQTDAAINPGNSGGPLVNAQGQVVGINTAIIKDSQSVGFALAIDAVKPRITDIKAGNGTINGDSPFLGVVTIDVSDQTADIIDRFRIDVDAGAFVADVQAGSAAAAAGLKQGDVITAIDGKKVTSNEDVGTVIRKMKAGDSISIEYERLGESRTGTAELGRRGG